MPLLRVRVLAMPVPGVQPRHGGEGVDDAVIAVAQQMREVVRQFGVVRENDVRGVVRCR